MYKQQHQHTHTHHHTRWFLCVCVGVCWWLYYPSTIKKCTKDYWCSLYNHSRPSWCVRILLYTNKHKNCKQAGVIFFFFLIIFLSLWKERKKKKEGRKRDSLCWHLALWGYLDKKKRFKKKKKRKKPSVFSSSFFCFPYLFLSWLASGKSALQDSTIK